MSEEDTIICHCLQVTESTIRRCIREGELTAIEQVTSACKAGGGCHSCHMLIQLFIDQSQGKTLFPAPTNGEKHEKGTIRRFFDRFKSKTPVT